MTWNIKQGHVTKVVVKHGNIVIVCGNQLKTAREVEIITLLSNKGESALSQVSCVPV